MPGTQVEDTKKYDKFDKNMAFYANSNPTAHAHKARTVGSQGARPSGLAWAVTGNVVEKGAPTLHSSFICAFCRPVMG
jgi:hypothetical protein